MRSSFLDSNAVLEDLRDKVADHADADAEGVRATARFVALVVDA